MSEAKNNPANIPELPAGYKPMTSSTLRLEVPEKKGYHRHWFRGTPERLTRAQQAGYEFVRPEEVQVNNMDLGGDSTASGNTDLGTRVSVISGESNDATGQPGRMYLMEVRDELFEYSQRLLADRNESVAEALRGGKIGAGEAGANARDDANRYIKGPTPDLFNPNKTRRA
jgi:hypothetical protein